MGTTSKCVVPCSFAECIVAHAGCFASVIKSQPTPGLPVKDKRDIRLSVVNKSAAWPNRDPESKTRLVPESNSVNVCSNTGTAAINPALS